MEYTKVMILHVNYGQGVKPKNKIWNLFYKISAVVKNHRFMTTVVSITLMLMVLDIMLVTNFVQVLSTVNL